MYGNIPIAGNRIAVIIWKLKTRKNPKALVRLFNKINAINLMNDAKDQHGRYEFQDFSKSSVGRRYTISLNGRL